ncbi:MAG: hypothetical protein IT265_03120 [Saprospiraceae bacterium]|nr:hypothetical protein [Saprospiraceae bacterium]
MTNDSINKFWALFRFKISIREFEKWVYSNANLETELGSENYLELISLNFKDKGDEGIIRNLIETIIKDLEYKCSCVKLSSIDTIGMGLDQDDFIGTFEQIKERGSKYWWLYMSKCKICKTYWLIAQEERHNDDFHLLKLNKEQISNILYNNVWPNEFDNYEDLLILSKNAGHSVRFMDPLNSSMIYTVTELAKNRPNINTKEISELLNIELEVANQIAKKAMEKENLEIEIVNY